MRSTNERQRAGSAKNKSRCRNKKIIPNRDSGYLEFPWAYYRNDQHTVKLQMQTFLLG
jgi:hypothetical protein